MEKSFYFFSWKVGVWGQCGTTCGYSLKARSVDCINEVGRHVNDSYCTERMPKMVEQCYSGQCPPEWVSGLWGEVGYCHEICFYEEMFCYVKSILVKNTTRILLDIFVFISCILMCFSGII